MRLLLKNAAQVLQVVDDRRSFLRGEREMKNLALIENGSIVVDAEGSIEDVGKADEIAAKYASNDDFAEVIDCSGMSVLPGLVDGHTHPVFAGDRVHEFAMKLAGASYMEVHSAGGGINFTVDHTRSASEEELEKLLLPRLERMIKAGTTLAECKSGYGLNTQNEIKMLRVLEAAKKKSAVEISSTFCGAHSVPKGLSAEEATEDVILNQLPEVDRLNRSGGLSVENVDVFCETGVFDVAQSKRILEAGQKVGLRVNFHAEELSCLGGAEMGAAIGAEAISHLEEVSDEGVRAMACSGSVAVILPTTAYILRLQSPPVRKMIEAGVIVALGSDFNPNAYCLEMPTVMHLACVHQRMSMTEAMAAATINAAHSLGRSATHGSIEKGKVADFVVVDAHKWEHLIYQLGGHGEIIAYVIKGGRIEAGRRKDTT